MNITFKKQADGGSTLTCTRPDGSVTWQTNPGRRGTFFALHDLTHYAVETVLDLQRGFYGLVRSGWDIEDTTGKGTRGPLPDEALRVEHLVGLLDQERAGAVVWNAADLNEQARIYFTSRERNAPPDISDDELDAIRERMRELFAEWTRVGPGESLTIVFPEGA